MANSATRIFLKNGKSFPHLLRSRLVGHPSSIVNKDQLLILAQPLPNPTHRLYLQRPMLGDGFNFVLGKNHELPREAEVEAREGKMRLVSRYEDEDEDEEEEEEDDDDDGEFDDGIDDHGDSLDEDRDEYAGSDDDTDTDD